HVFIAPQHHVEGGVERLDHVHRRHDQTPVCWRWRRRCHGMSLYTSSNIVFTLGILPSPRVPLAVASAFAARTCSTPSFCAASCFASSHSPSAIRCCFKRSTG